MQGRAADCTLENGKLLPQDRRIEAHQLTAFS
jgi:hypothetical protein